MRWIMGRQMQERNSHGSRVDVHGTIPPRVAPYRIKDGLLVHPTALIRLSVHSVKSGFSQSVKIGYFSRVFHHLAPYEDP
jgi:hypothetical protein